MFESGMFRARALAAGGRYAAGMLRPVRRSAAQSAAAAATAFSDADAGELPADGAQALNFRQAATEIFFCFARASKTYALSAWIGKNPEE
jgi:hypothetical protein